MLDARESCEISQILLSSDSNRKHALPELDLCKILAHFEDLIFFFFFFFSRLDSCTLCKHKQVDSHGPCIPLTLATTVIKPGYIQL